MTFCGKALLVIFFVFLIDLVAGGHPQCLDHLPPFRNRPAHCNQYRPNSCCTDNASLQLKRKVNKFLKAFVSDREARIQCRPYLRNVTCTECSPWAFHVYEAETADTLRVLPSLCHNYCIQFYNNCYPALFDYYKLNSTGYDKDSAQQFCRDQMPNDPTYCYPSVIQGPQFTDNTTEEIDFGNELHICVLPITDGLRNPTALVHSNDQTGRLFVTEQIGVIHVISRNRVRLSTPFLNISHKVLTSPWFGDERGLLGMVFHPNFKENGKFYVYYSTRSTTFDANGNSTNHLSRISQFLALNGSDVADASSEQIVMTIPQPLGNHNGGQLLFKEDGSLLIILGDGGGAGDRHGTIGNGLNRSTLLGSILRINVSSLPYTIPEDNPFVNNSDWQPEIYAYGLRNPWRCSFDRGDSKGRGKGRLFCGDVGQSEFEEIDIIEKGGNYGWRAFEGNECFDRNLCNVLNDTIFPIHVYPHSAGRSVTGGYVYRGCSFPKLQGLYFFADFVTGTIWTLRERSESWNLKRVSMGGKDICHSGLVGNNRTQHIISFGEDENGTTSTIRTKNTNSGELYILGVKRPSPVSPQGTVYQVIEPERRGRCKS